MPEYKNSNHFDDFLEMEMIDSSPRLAQMLPFQVADRYHAIPVAEEQGRMTIALACPENREAREKIIQEIKTPVTFVRSSREEIDQLIASCYQESLKRSVSFMIWTSPEKIPEESFSYIHHLSELISADIHWTGKGPEGPLTHRQLVDESKHLKPDLIFCPELTCDRMSRAGFHRSVKRLYDSVSPGLLTFKQSIWPIRRILLVLQEYDIDSDAVNWAIRLASTAKAHLTILPLLPPVPLMFADLQHDAVDLLQSSSRLGKILRTLMQRLRDWEIEGTLKLREEVPEWQVCNECEGTAYDLVILSTGDGLWKKFTEPDLVSILLDRIAAPLLISKSSPRKEPR